MSFIDGYQPKTIQPPPPVSLASSNKTRSKNAQLNFEWRKRNPHKQLAKNKAREARRYGQVLEELSLPSINCYDLPSNHSERILSARKELESRKLKVCAIDMENVVIAMVDGTEKSAPCWVSVVNSEGRLIYNSLIRHPSGGISRPLTQLHGLSHDHWKYAPFFCKVRSDLMEILNGHDRIIVSDQTADFVSLFIDCETHSKLLDKIICVSSFYNCSRANDALGLKFCSFLLFGDLIKQTVHSPIIDAKLTMFCYLVDFEGMERIRRQNIDNGIMVYKNHNYMGFNYPKNTQMAGLLSDVMAYIGDWPLPLKVDPFSNICLRKRAYKEDDYIQGASERRDPYIFNREIFESFVNFGQVANTDQPSSSGKQSKEVTREELRQDSIKWAIHGSKSRQKEKQSDKDKSQEMVKDSGESKTVNIAKHSIETLNKVQEEKKSESSEFHDSIYASFSKELNKLMDEQSKNSDPFQDDYTFHETRDRSEWRVNENTSEDPSSSDDEDSTTNPRTECKKSAKC